MSQQADDTLHEETEEVFVFPTSFAQQRLWIIDQLEPGRPTYNIPFNVRLSGALDVRALQSAFDYLVERHETLRTVFDARDGVPMQVVRPFEPLELPLVDLASLDDYARQLEVDRLVSTQANTPFNLRTGPLFRALVAKIHNDEHLLLITAHHIVVDGWSLGVLQRELGAAYAAYTRGEEPGLDELPIQYVDFAGWQRGRLEGAVLEEQLTYWKQQLAHPLPVLDVPADRPRTNAEAHLAERVPVEVPLEVSNTLTALARAQEATPFMALLAGYQALLHRYSGQDDIVVGSPVAGRTRRETEGLIGFFVNTLALRTSFGDSPTFRQLLDRVRATTLAALAHQDVPFEKIVEVIQPERDRNRNPVFQTLFSLQDLGTAGALEMPGLTIAKIGSTRETAKFELQLLMNSTTRGYRGLLEYDADLFDLETAAQFGRHFTALITAAVAEPDRPIATLPLLSDDERRVFEHWNATAADYPATALVHELVAAQAAKTPTAPAVTMDGVTLDYATLDARAAALAARLQAAGVGPDARVAIWMDRSVHTIVAVLGVLKAGGAYVPVDPSYPAARASYMLQNADVRVVVTVRAIAGEIPAHAAATIVLDDPAPAKTTSNAEGTPRPTPDHLAYVLYTSGSTGLPKGVAMPHRPLVNLLAWQQRQSNAAAGTRTLQFASLSFDVSFQEIFSTLTTGGTLVLVDEMTRRDAEALLRVIEREQVERIFLPFIALQHLADAAVARAGASYALREIITAGEQLRITPAIRTWLAQLPGVTLANHYGPTESHVVTALDLAGSAHDWPELPSIGRPIANTAVHLLDAHGAPVPIGVTGELFIAGTPLARGYLNAPERTAERFSKDPFSNAHDARMYRTGDLARFRRDGTIDYLGRGDGQVKLRGFRIELGEVEAVIARSSLVAACAAMVREDVPGDRALVAYVVRAAPSGIDAVDLRALCKAELPEFMVPSAFVFLDAMPLTPSGKVDRRSLPAVDRSATSDGRSFTAPRTPAEKQVAAIWAEVLRVPRVGVDDSFFDLGGHSLLATRMVSRVRDAFRRDVPLRALFDHPTLGDFVGALEQVAAPASAASARIAAIPRAAARRAVPPGGRP